MLYKLAAIPLISALIGYLTNVIAIKLLFWPVKPVNIAGFKIQGLLPKRQTEIAASLGILIEEQLLSLEDLFIQADTPLIRQQLTEKLVSTVLARMSAMLPRFTPNRLVQAILDLTEKMIRQETPAVINEVLADGKAYLQENIKIKSIIEEKIIDLDFLELEDIVKGVSTSEIRFIEVLGGILGLMIGLVQVLILLFFPF